MCTHTKTPRQILIMIHTYRNTLLLLSPGNLDSLVQRYIYWLESLGTVRPCCATAAMRGRHAPCLGHGLPACRHSTMIQIIHLGISWKLAVIHKDFENDPVSISSESVFGKEINYPHSRERFSAMYFKLAFCL